MVAHFADLGILAATAGVYGAGFVIATILRGRTLLSGGHGYGERITLKYLSLAAVYFSTLVLYVAYSLDKPFGHKLVSSHQINRAVYVLWAIINPLFMFAVGLSFSASEHYVFIGKFVQLAASLMSLIGAWNAESQDAAVWFCILGFVFQVLSGFYSIFMCVPPPEWQAQHGGSGHWIVRVVIGVLMLYFPIALIIDNVYLNTIHDDERKIAIANFVLGTLIHVVIGIWLLWSWDVVPTPPLGFSFSGTGSGGFSAAAQNWQFQNLQAQGAGAPGAAPAEGAPAAAASQWNLRVPQ